VHLLLLLACSNFFKDNAGNPANSDDTGDTDPVLDDTGEDTGDSDVEPECPTPPGPGTVTTNSDCTYAPGPSGTPFSASIEWAMTHAVVDPATGSTISAYTFSEYVTLTGVFQSPAVGQATDDNGDGVIDEDDTPDVIVLMGDEFSGESTSAIRVISGDGSQVHDSLLWDTYSGTEYAPYLFAGLAMGDVDLDGLQDIATVVTTSAGSCYPALYTVSDTGGLALDRVYTADSIPCESHAPALADIDIDGNVEIILGNAVYSNTLGLTFDIAAEGDGWYNSDRYGAEGYWNSGYHSFAYDMDGDGDMEIVAGSHVYNNDGTEYCELAYYSGGWQTAMDGYPAVADILGNDGDPEIVITGNQYVTLYRGVPNSSGYCQAVSTISNDPYGDGLSLPTHPEGCDTTRRSFGGQPTIADFDGDGRPDVGVAGACWYTVYTALSGSLERYAMTPTKDWSSASTGSTVFDFNGDGAAEVVFSDENAVYVWGVDTSSGLDPWERFETLLEDDNHKSWTIHEYPLVADVDGDGKAEIVAVNGPNPDNRDNYGIYVLGAADDDWVSARAVWNQHAYYVTNVYDDGSVGYGAPNYSPYTANDFNSFRQQAPGTFGAKAASNVMLEVDSCQADCGYDVEITVQVGNEGAYITAPGGLVLNLYGWSGGSRTLLDSTTVPSDVAPGELTGAMVFTRTDWADWDQYEVVVDDPEGTASSWGAAKECDEGDNAEVISTAGFCE
jgi:hypothetical protein